MKWKLRTLGDLGEWGSGGTPLSSIPEYYNGTIPWLIIEDLNDGIVTSSQKTITELGLKNSSAKIVEPGTLLIAMYGSIGKLGITGIRCATNQAIAFCRHDPKLVDVDFLFYYLLYSREKLLDLGKGNTQQNIGQAVLKEYPIPLPPLSEQKRIASLLARADRLRGLRRVAREQCDSLLQSVFLEMFGDYLNKIECQFADVLEIPLTNGFFEKNEKYGTGNPIIWVDNLYHTNIIDISALRRVQVSEKELGKYEVIEGDLLFTRSSLVAEGVGQANIVPKLEERTMFESHIIRARVDKTKINPYYALGLFRSQFGKSEIMKRAKTATMTTIGQDALYEFPCPIPPLGLQEEFARVVARVESLRARMDESARQGEGLFQSLLAESFG
ncbi:MAG TPA: restriction endonuclease subunit S [Anaerolineales bacterium]|nr:restriction endonuclease subunit S [Anaerolineales bacterium]